MGPEVAVVVVGQLLCNTEEYSADLLYHSASKYLHPLFDQLK
jgi:O-acetylhomoserine/O-acetylserine sulfhydrylase-like pyridoxal-dependent enzyme